MNVDAAPTSIVLPLVDALTSGGDDAPAFLVQLEDDWAALAVKPSGVLLVLLDARAPEPWDAVLLRASQVLRTETEEVLAGLADGVMGVVLVGSPLGPEELAGAPHTLPELGRTVHWIVIGPSGGVFVEARPGLTAAATAVHKELDGLVTTAFARAVRSGVKAALWSDVERAGEQALAAEARFRGAMQRRYPPVTVALIAVCVAMFGLEHLWGALDSGYALGHMGAASGAAFAAGHYEVLLSYALLHGGAMHILMNGLALDSLGRMLENLIGGKRFLVVFTLSAIGGGIASVLVKPESLVVGASGGIFGLMTALLGLTMRKSGELPTLARQRLRKALGSTLLLNVFISMLPGVSLLGHAGGAVVGFVLGISGLVSIGTEVPWQPKPDPVRAARMGRLFDVLALLCGLAIVAAGGTALARGKPWAIGPGATRTVALEGTRYVLDVPSGLAFKDEMVPGTSVRHIVVGTLPDGPMLVEAHTIPLDDADVTELGTDEGMLKYFNGRKEPVEVVGAKAVVKVVDGTRWVTIEGKMKVGADYARWAFVDGRVLVDAEAVLLPRAPASWKSAFSGAEPHPAR